MRVVSASVGETRRLGVCLARLLRPGDLVLLRGPFGAGKTTLTQGIARGLGIEAAVTSPSFTLVNEYRGPDRGKGPLLYHVDLYRIASSAEALDLGLDEYLTGQAIAVIEWPEQAEGSLPAEHLDIAMAYLGDKGRALVLSGHGERYVGIVDAFAAQCLPMTLWHDGAGGAA